MRPENDREERLKQNILGERHGLPRLLGLTGCGGLRAAQHPWAHLSLGSLSLAALARHTPQAVGHHARLPRVNPPCSEHPSVKWGQK